MAEAATQSRRTPALLLYLLIFLAAFNVRWSQAKPEPRYVEPHELPPETNALQTRHDTRQASKDLSVQDLPDALRKFRFNAPSGPAVPSLQGAAGERNEEIESKREELADIAIVVSVDGAIHAIRRDTGLWVWSLHDDNENEQRQDILRSPLVRSGSRHNLERPKVGVPNGFPAASNNSDAHGSTEDADETYIIEPHSGGDIYVYHRKSGKLQRLPLSVTQLVSLSPFTFPSDVSVDGYATDGKLFVGRKETKIVGVDLQSGKLVGVFGPEAGWCEWQQSNPSRVKTSADADSIENRPCDLLYIGRTDYHVSIYSKNDGLLQTLTYTAYGPSTLSTEGLRSGTESSDGMSPASQDGLYIQPLHNGELYCFEQDKDTLRWRNQFSSAIVGVYDIFFPTTGSSYSGDDSLPHSRSQPLLREHSLRPSNAVLAQLHDAYSSTFVGKLPGDEDELSEDQGYFAMSNRHFPLVALVGAAPAVEGHFRPRNRSSLDEDPLLGSHPVDLPIESGRTLDSVPERPMLDPVPPSQSQAAHTDPRSLPEVGRVTSRGLLDLATLPNAVLATLSCILACLYFRQQQKLARRAESRTGQSKTIQLASSARKTPDRRDSALPLSGKSPAARASKATTALEAQLSAPDQEKPLGLASGQEHTLPHSRPETVEAAKARETESTREASEASGLSNGTLQASSSDDEAEGPEDVGPSGTPSKKGRRRRRGKRPGQRAAALNENVKEVPGLPKLAIQPPENAPPQPPNGHTGPGDLDNISQRIGPVMSISQSDRTASSNAKVGGLAVTERIIGYGSHGTIVLKGTFQGRAVAVKRLLSTFVTVASHEVRLLQESDIHPNVIRYFCKEEHKDFLYIALEECAASLFEVIDSPQKFPDLASAFDPFKALTQICRGLSHLHKLKIVHRDLKPQNILVASSSPFRVVISDFGLCKKLDHDQSSWQLTGGAGSNAPGSFGYRAPEVIRGEVLQYDLINADGETESSEASDRTIAGTVPAGTPRKLTRAIDIFSLGCIFYFVLTNGDHPFGTRHSREMNILEDKICLEGLSVMPARRWEAEQLIKMMCSQDPVARPTASGTLLNPLFWPAHTSLSFLCDASDRFEIMDKDASPVLALERHAKSVVGSDWLKTLDRNLVDNLGKYRKYDPGSVRDLLRVIRNKRNHFQDLPENVRRSLGEPPAGFLGYFSKRYPKLLLHVHSAVATHLKHEHMFSRYFDSSDDA